MDSNIANNEEVQHHSPTNDAMQQDDVNAGEHNLQHELVENTNELKFYNELESYFLREEYPSGATKAVIQRRSKKFQLVDGVLHYKGAGGTMKKV